MNCLKCNYENNDDAIYCENCGSKLVDKHRCKKCGSIINDKAHFCKYCGHKQINEKTGELIVKESKTKLTRIANISLVASIMLITVFMLIACFLPIIKLDSSNLENSETDKIGLFNLIDSIKDYSCTVDESVAQLDKVNFYLSKIIVIVSIIVAIIIVATSLGFIIYHSIQVILKKDKHLSSVLKWFGVAFTTVIVMTVIASGYYIYSYAEMYSISFSGAYKLNGLLMSSIILAFIAFICLSTYRFIVSFSKAYLSKSLTKYILNIVKYVSLIVIIFVGLKGMIKINLNENLDFFEGNSSIYTKIMPLQILNSTLSEAIKSYAGKTWNSFENGELVIIVTSMISFVGLISAYVASGLTSINISSDKINKRTIVYPAILAISSLLYLISTIICANKYGDMVLKTIENNSKTVVCSNVYVVLVFSLLILGISISQVVLNKYKSKKEEV